MRNRYEKEVILPATVWKMKTGNNHITEEYIDWMQEKKQQFVEMMRRTRPTIERQPFSAGDLEMFREWIYKTEAL